MREQLLGYLLGALEPDEVRQVEEQLRRDPELRFELDELRDQLIPLEEAEEVFEPPAGLVQRTVTAVKADRTPPTPAGGRDRRWRASDTIASAVACGLAAVLFFPVLLNSRYQARLDACQNNLRQVGTQLISYAQRQPDQSYPAMDADGKLGFSGAAAVRLYDRGFIDQRPTVLLCPSGTLELSQWSGVPSVDSLEASEGHELEELRNLAGGSYGWYLGAREEGRYRVPRHQGRTHFALISDAPSQSLPGLASANHGGIGWNIFYDDGHVAYIKASRIRENGDDPFRNHNGIVDLGVCENDAVITWSGAKPLGR